MRQTRVCLPPPAALDAKARATYKQRALAALHQVRPWLALPVSREADRRCMRIDWRPTHCPTICPCATQLNNLAYLCYALEGSKELRAVGEAWLEQHQVGGS